MITSEHIKIMYLNPVGISTFDQTFADMARAYKEADTEVHICSLRPEVGAMNNLEYRTFQTFTYLDTLKAVRQAAQEGFDALIIGCFYDPGLEDCREIAGDMLVIGPCQSSIAIAMRIANSYSVIIGRNKWLEQMKKAISGYGYLDHLASFRELQMTVPQFVSDAATTEKRIIEQALLAVNEDRAESIILGCTLETGFYQEVQKVVGVPVIDPSIAALKTAEHAARLKKQCQWSTAKKWSMEPPSEADLQQFGLLQEVDVLGNRLVIY